MTNTSLMDLTLFNLPEQIRPFSDTFLSSDIMNGIAYPSEEGRDAKLALRPHTDLLPHLQMCKSGTDSALKGDHWAHVAKETKGC